MRTVGISLLYGTFCISFAFYLLPVVFSFDPVQHNFSEGDGDVSLSVSLVSGDIGDFTIQVTAATDDSSSAATATGKV
jgi:hypothetical protein